MTRATSVIFILIIVPMIIGSCGGISRLCEQSGFACSSGHVKPWSGDMSLPGKIYSCDPVHNPHGKLIYYPYYWCCCSVQSGMA